ncbi:hypothetical protein FKM82_029561 [Ascaphus truei]
MPRVSGSIHKKSMHTKSIGPELSDGPWGLPMWGVFSSVYSGYTFGNAIPLILSFLANRTGPEVTRMSCQRPDGHDHREGPGGPYFSDFQARIVVADRDDCGME